jgi:hypothetical protein
MLTWSQVLDQAQQLLASVHAAKPKTATKIPTAHGHILGMFWRSVRLFDGILLLLQGELPEEAAILARPLFEESLRLQQLGADSTEREALILKWANDSIQEKKGLVEVAKSVGLEANPVALLSRLDDEQRKLQGYARRHGVTRLRPFMMPRDAALRFGRGADYYWSYQWSHEAVHGSDAAWLFARRKVSTDTVGLFAKTTDPRILGAMVSFSANSFGEATRATFTIFGWSLPEFFDQRLSALQQAANAYDG